MSFFEFANFILDNNKNATVYTGIIPPIFFHENIMKSDIVLSWKTDDAKKKTATPPIDYNFYQPTVNSYHVLLAWPVKVSATIDSSTSITLNLKDFWIKNFSLDQLNEKESTTFADLLANNHYYGLTITDDVFNDIINQIFNKIVSFRTQSKKYPRIYYQLYSNSKKITQLSNLCHTNVEKTISENQTLLGNVDVYLRHCPYLWTIPHDNTFKLIKNKEFNDWTEYAAFMASQYNRGVGNHRMIDIAKEQYVKSTAFDIIRLEDIHTKSIVEATLSDWENATTPSEKIQFLKTCRLVDNSWYTTKSGVYVCCNHEYVMLNGKNAPTISYDNNKICVWCNEVIETNTEDTNVFAEGRIDINENNINEASIIDENNNTTIDDMLKQERLNKSISRRNAYMMYRLKVVLDRSVTQEDVNRYSPTMRAVRKAVDLFLRLYNMKPFKNLFESIREVGLKFEQTQKFDMSQTASVYRDILNHFNLPIKTSDHTPNEVESYTKINTLLLSYFTSRLNHTRIDTRIFRFINSSQHIPVNIIHTLGDAYAVAIVDKKNSVNFNDVYINPKTLMVEVIFNKTYYESLMNENFKQELRNMFVRLNSYFTENIDINFKDRKIVINDPVLTFDKDVLELKQSNTTYTNVDYYNILSYYADCGNPKVIDHVKFNNDVLISLNKIGIIKLIKDLTIIIYNDLKSKELKDNTITLCEDFLTSYGTYSQLSETCNENAYDDHIVNLSKSVETPIETKYNLDDMLYRNECKSIQFSTDYHGDVLTYNGAKFTKIDANFKHSTSSTTYYTGELGQNGSNFFTKIFSNKNFKYILFTTYRLGITYLLKLYYNSIQLEDSMNAVFVLNGFISDCRVKLWNTTNTVLKDTILENGIKFRSTYEYVLNDGNKIEKLIDSFAYEVASYLMVIDSEYSNIIDWIYTELDWRALVSITPTEYENTLLATIKYNERARRRDENTDEENEEDQYDIPIFIDDDQYDILANNDDDVEAMDDGIQSLYSDDLIIDNEGMY